MNIPAYTWVEQDPAYIKGIVYARMPSGVALCFIRPMYSWPWNRAPREYQLKFVFEHIGSNRPIGGYYPSIEEAKKGASRMLEHIFGDEEIARAK